MQVSGPESSALTQAINGAKDRGDIELLELIARDPQAFILKQGWASVSFDPVRGLVELRSLDEHLQARILEMIETLDELRASAEMEIFREVEQDEKVIGRIVSEQREELEQEIAGFQAEAEKIADEARELAGEMPTLPMAAGRSTFANALPKIFRKEMIRPE